MGKNNHALSMVMHLINRAQWGFTERDFIPEKVFLYVEMTMSLYYYLTELLLGDNLGKIEASIVITLLSHWVKTSQCDVGSEEV